MRKVRDQLASKDRQVNQLGDLLFKTLFTISFILLRKHGSKLPIVHPHFGSRVVETRPVALGFAASPGNILVLGVLKQTTHLGCDRLEIIVSHDGV